MTPRSQPDTPRSQAIGANDAPRASGPTAVSLDSSIFKEVHVDLSARLGQVDLSVEELLALRPGSVIKLESQLNDLVELRLNSSIVARGEIVAVGDHFGLRIVDVVRIP